MPCHFCPKCGTNLLPDFRFCPSCGGKLPFTSDEKVEANTTIKINYMGNASSEPVESKERENVASTAHSLAASLRKSCRPLGLVKDTPLFVTSPTYFVRDHSVEDIGVGCPVSPFKQQTEMETNLESTSSGSSTRSGKGKGKVTSLTKRKVEESQSPCEKAVSPRGKSKRAKLAPSLELLQEGQEVSDMVGKKWTLLKLLSQSPTELLYEASPLGASAPDYILKLGAKDGRIFNEQNFLQRAAKPTTVDKWIHQNKMDFLGIPTCAGFGLHADSYRFLIFPKMGRSLGSIIQEDNKLLSEKVVLWLACRILDVLQYIHANEYVHADINAGNVFVSPGLKAQVYLAGYYHAFRYCPGGQHVEYRESSRTAHEGSLPFISMDTHKGAGASRRSDLESLGYCMVHWHTGKLPWIDLTQPDQVAAQKQKYKEDVSSLLSVCFGTKKAPGAFQVYLSSVMALEYTQEPDYTSLKTALVAALQQLGGSVEAPLSL